jgi:hypothetical protein
MNSYLGTCCSLFWWCLTEMLNIHCIRHVKVLVLFGIHCTCTLPIFPMGCGQRDGMEALENWPCMPSGAFCDLGDAVVKVALSWAAPARTTRTEHAEILPLSSLSPSKLVRTPARVSTLAFCLCGCEHYTFWPMWAAWTCIHSWALSYLVGSFEGYKNPYSNSAAAPQEVLYSTVCSTSSESMEGLLGV